MKFTESQLQSFAAPLSTSEEERCKNAIRMIRDAMKLLGYSDDNKEIRRYEEDTLAFALDLRSSTGNEITLLVQGSFANNTNVRTLSDVDVAVILESTFIPKYKAGITGKNYNFSDATFSVASLKDDVESALNKKFNNDGVERKDKSIKIHGNSYRVNSDVVPSYRFRDYSSDYIISESNYVGGIEIRPDSGGSLRNYPEQHIKNGRKKNNDTNYCFKKHVRIIKKMRQVMVENGYSSAGEVSSFGLESLLWNIPNNVYSKYQNIYRYTFDELLIFLSSDFGNLDNYKEANGIKPLFSASSKKGNYENFITNLRSFYEYDITEK